MLANQLMLNASAFFRVVIFQELENHNTAISGELKNANLRWADLSGANMSGADLSRADLSWADLRGADLDLKHISI